MDRAALAQAVAATYAYKPMTAYFKYLELQNYFLSGIEVRKPVMDVGCNEGVLGHVLAAVGIVDTVEHGVEISEEVVQRARARSPYTHIHQADLKALPFPDAFAETILSHEVLQAMAPGFEEGIREMYRVLKRGGYCIVTVPVIHFHDLIIFSRIFKKISRRLYLFYQGIVRNRVHDYNLFSAEEWQRHLTRYGFKIRYVRGFFNKRNGVVWNILSLQVFRVFGVLRRFKLPFINKCVVTCMAKMLERAGDGAQEKDGRFGYVFIVAQKE